MTKLCFDYGHGGIDPGAIYKGRRESEDVLNLGREVAKEMRRHGVIVDETRTSDLTMSLIDRSDFANENKYDYFISFHRNAFKPEAASGVESYIFSNAKSQTRQLAEKLQQALVTTGFDDRGVKTANFYVLKATKAPAILLEIGFIDNGQDNALFDTKRVEIVKAISGAILSQLGLAYIEESQNDLEKALGVLVRNGIIKSPEYWLENAQAGKTVKGEYAGLLIEKITEYISSQ
ncbi:MAG: N-acetylmuramoyl-L-alanine amidase family protein [Acidobacteriota bacterium]